jgi:hypothetical protein
MASKGSFVIPTEPPFSLGSPLMSSQEPSPQFSPKDIQLPPSPPPDGQLPLTPAQSRPSPRFRGSSEPLSNYPVSPLASLNLPFRPRTQSPSRLHTRPHTSLGAPPMQRAHSSPGLDSSGRFIQPPYVPRRPSSPLHSGRRRSPLRSAMEESYPGMFSRAGLNIEPNIPENEELEILSEDLPQSSPIPAYSITFPRSRRRPTSPLHQSASAPSLKTQAVSPNTSRSASPSYLPNKYTNEPYPLYPSSSASSMPSTPTSMRSRSPSISSLETIEDIPDAEAAAMLEEEDARQKAEDSDGSSEQRRRSSLELRGSSLRSNKERKRWSVCGAERRADFSLEPIEE